MTILNVSFGIYAFLPEGWIFMIAIIIIKCLAFPNCFQTPRIMEKFTLL